MSVEEEWRIRITDADGTARGAGVLIAGRYVLTAAHVVAAALGTREDGDRPAGRVRFDLPMRPDLGTRSAEIVWWLPVRADRGGDLAGLSVVGPAPQGVGDPPLGHVGSVTGQTVRLHGYPRGGQFPDGLTARARLVGYSASELIQLSRVGEGDPVAGEGYSGAGVVEESSGNILGIARAAAGTEARRVVWMCPVDKVAQRWAFLAEFMRLQASTDLRARLARAREVIRSGDRPRPTAKEDLLGLVKLGMDVPGLANSQSRHSIVSELPLSVCLTAPRSSSDRADLAALLWTCLRTPRAVARLRPKLQAMEQTASVRALIRELGKPEK